MGKDNMVYVDLDLFEEEFTRLNGLAKERNQTPEEFMRFAMDRYIRKENERNSVIIRGLTI